MNSFNERRDAFSAKHLERRVTVNQRDWGVLKLGNTGPKLILLPGTLGRADIFWQQIEAMHGRAQILALSYPDSGGLADWAADVAALMAKEHMQGAVVLGSSMGGYLAQYLAATQPALFTGLIAANTLASVHGVDQTMPYVLDLDATPIADLRRIFTTGLANWATPHPNAALAALLLGEVKTRITGAEMKARINVLKYAPELPAPQLPQSRTFIIDAGDDHLISASMRADLRAALPAKAFHFPTGSHFPYVTHAAQYTTILEEVLGL
jgi:pimeloyl-ACP methyl ester carboxylesterase